MTKTDSTSVGEDTEKANPYQTLVRAGSRISAWGKPAWKVTEVNHVHTLRPSDLTPRYVPIKTEITCPSKNMYKNVSSSFIITALNENKP